ncbi:MAG: hypothetical protein KF773_23760 [Deltaproteobacteria bacterium]|nr:hypothetical protein [Deltaproteobacteria bacterium]
MLGFAACGTSPSGDDGDDTQDLEMAFSVTSADITLQPGEEKTFCYYFRTPNTSTIAVAKWVSNMTPGSHHMIYFANLGTQPADGTIDECNINGIPLPVYGTQVPHEEVLFPTDDGEGYPLAQNVNAGTAGFFQMHYLNSTDNALTTHVTLEAYALKPGVVYTQTDLFATYNNDIAIPPNAVDHRVSATCDVVNKKFWSMSTHSHKQSKTTRVKDGTAMVFESLDWEHPGNRRFETPTFFQFDSAQITWECSYDNLGDNSGRTVRAGQSARTDEMCMATGYYFPATGPKGCVRSNGQCQCLL